MSLFTPRGDERRAAAVRALKQLAAELLGAGDDDTVLVNELACAEPGCPPIETVVALLRADAPPRQLKVHKPALEVTAEDLLAALAAGPSHREDKLR
jgi:hypothetical protein